MGVERESKRDLDPTLVRAYANAVVNRYDCFPYQLSDGSYKQVKSPLTLDLVKSHLLGLSPTLGTYALDEESYAKWICIDADDDKGRDQLFYMASDLAMQNLTPYLEESRRGLHLWLFFSRTEGITARKFGLQLTEEYDIQGVEVFPKRGKLTTGAGSLVRLPLGIHRRVGKRFHFVDLEGNPLAPTITDQIHLLSSPKLVPVEFIEEVVARVPSPESKTSPALKRRRSPKSVESENLSDHIKSLITVDEFIGRFVNLDENGKGLCPFHDDNVISFQVNKERNYWSCYAGCGGGSIIDFWMKWRELHRQDPSFKATLHDLKKLLQ